MNDIAFIALTNGGFTIVDADLFPSLNDDRWSLGKSNGSIFRNTGCYIPKSGNKRLTVLLHRVVNQTPKGLQTDHINGYKIDNRRCNLRPVNGAQNCWNQRKRRGDYTSKFKGVHFARRPGRYDKWIAFIGSTKFKRKFLGQFWTEEEAARAYDQAAREQFGEYAVINFPLHPPVDQARPYGPGAV